MTISKENRDFIQSLLDYYISESESYRQFAENYRPGVESVPDTAFGIIVGCMYSGFLQAYQNQQLTPGLEDVNEFNEIIKKKAVLIRRAILGEDISQESKGEESGDADTGSSVSEDPVDPGDAGSSVSEDPVDADDTRMLQAKAGQARPGGEPQAAPPGTTCNQLQFNSNVMPVRS